MYLAQWSTTIVDEVFERGDLTFLQGGTRPLSLALLTPFQCLPLPLQSNPVQHQIHLKYNSPTNELPIQIEIQKIETEESQPYSVNTTDQFVTNSFSHFPSCNPMIYKIRLQFKYIPYVIYIQ